MRSLLILSTLLGLTACGQKDSKDSSSSGAGSATKAPPVEQPSATPPTTGSGSASASAPAPAPPPPLPPASDGAEEVAELVVRDVGSKALGSQKIEASCVSVVTMPAGTWTVAAAWLKNCGDKTARSILWLYKRGDGGKWSEDYVGQPPRCWKGVPPDIAEAVTKATKIPSC